MFVGGVGGATTPTQKRTRFARPLSFPIPPLSQSVTALVAHPDADAAHAFPVDLLHVATVDPTAATALLAAPTAARAALASALSTAQTAAASAPTAPPDACVKRRAVPVLHPPPPPSLLAADVPARGVRARHAGALLTLAGAIVRAGGVRALEAATEWECSACGAATRTEADVALRAAPPPPPPCDGGGGLRGACRGAWTAAATHHDDVQEVVLAEPAAGLRPRDRPRAVTVVLRGPLAGSLAAGDDAAVCGVLAPRWPAPGPTALKEGRRPDLDYVLLACGASRGREGVAPPPGGGGRLAAWRAAAAVRPLAARDALAAAVAPHLAGLAPLKLAIALQLAAPPPREGGAAGGGRARAAPHVLFRGPPSTGKTALLRSAAALAPRSVFVSGRAASSAGLTAAAVREPDGGGWALEAGALALADGGLAAVDRLDALPPTDRAALHEAMEQQTVSVAKAGLVATLNTRAAVLAAAGAAPHAHARGGRRGGPPPGGLEAPLLSRFDLVFDLSDAHSVAHDDAVCDAVLADATADGGGGGGGDSHPSSSLPPGRPPTCVPTPPGWRLPPLRPRPPCPRQPSVCFSQPTARAAATRPPPTAPRAAPPPCAPWSRWPG